MIPFLISSLTLIVLDVLFLWFQKQTFETQLRIIQGDTKIKLFGIVLCYACLIFALNYFILFPKRSILDAFFLGICIYGVYEGTTYATLNKWSLSLVAKDTLWGGILFAVSTWISSLYIKKI